MLVEELSNAHAKLLPLHHGYAMSSRKCKDSSIVSINLEQRSADDKPTRAMIDNHAGVVESLMNILLLPTGPHSRAYLASHLCTL